MIFKIEDFTLLNSQTQVVKLYSTVSAPLREKCTVKLLIDDLFILNIHINKVCIMNKVDIILDLGKDRNLIVTNKLCGGAAFNMRMISFSSAFMHRIYNRFATSIN